jgi:hypothetical protein
MFVLPAQYMNVFHLILRLNSQQEDIRHRKSPQYLFGYCEFRKNQFGGNVYFT